jgi:23S rRNA G2069 N7-methylase RlmK/C1962 C5-methylase RlmI
VEPRRVAQPPGGTDGDGGVFFFSTNFRHLKLAEAEIHGVTIREIGRQTVPADFRNRRMAREAT